MPIWQMNGIDEAFSWHIAWQNLDQAPFLQILANDERRQHGQSKPAENRLRQRLVVVDAQRTGYRDRNIAVAAIEMPDPCVFMKV
jgi:hypothetical protein